MAFEAFLTQNEFKTKKRPVTTAASLVVHAGLAASAVVYSFWHVDEISPPTVTVTFLTAAPPPPPPPPPKKKSSGKVKPVVHREIVQPSPTEIVQPKEEPEEEEAEGTDDGVEGGVEGGVAGGVVGGVIGGVVSPEPAAAPKFLPPNVAKSQLLTDPAANSAYAVALPPALKSSGMQLWAMIKVCVSKEGNVSDVKIIKGMDPAVDPLLRAKVLTWKYKPYSIDGRPTPFCYNMRYQHTRG